ncbi:protein HOS4 isoform X2 [Monomorium pharaonis]|nr:protein HOS4 isoform X2 [Monomorium pharaonis]XP_036139977.1 protein HOS4 isoform X2 [Monomorium pharaonis]XP_036139979.1 protein HOS4 isoform X2 [Monomorium pharaonis]XP_036139982.1 protein HOS4 isoform X2 [Monomorium pharaonis]
MVGGRRVKHAASNETTTTSMVTGGVTNRSDNNVVVSTVQPTTTQQKVRRIFEEQARWQESGPRSRVKCTSSDAAYCVVNNCSIAVTKGEPARNNRAASETTTTTTNVTGKRRAPSIVNGRIHSKEEAARSGILAAEESRKPKDVSKARPGISRGVQRGIIKSASVPKDLKEGLPVRERTLQRVPEEGILKRSSAFLASLTHHHPSSKLAERNSPDDELVKFLRPTSKLVNGYEPRGSSSSRYTGLKGYFLTNGDEGLCALRPSPSVQTLSTSLKKKGIGVKKSVSFSSDTSFEEKRVPYRKPAVHEAKVYRKGVLQDHIRKETIKSKVPPSWETPSGGPTALLRAAREADDTGLKEIVAQARKVGLKGMDVNVVDSSGRTAISYMAGNGASSMLELALSFEGVDPNLPDNEGNTPLHFAAQAGQTECLNILLERCPDIEVDARNTLGFTPLMKAALQGRTKCAKILLFAGANPTLRDHGRGLRAEQWARFCGRYACAEMIERFARHRLLERTTSCRWGSEPELAAKVLQGKVTPIPPTPLPQSSGLKSKIRKVFRTTSSPDRTFSLVSQLTSAALCASSPALPKPSPVVKSLLRPLSVPQLRVTLVSQQDFLEKTSEKCGTNFTDKIENSIPKPPRSKKKSK